MGLCHFIVRALVASLLATTACSTLPEVKSSGPLTEEGVVPPPDPALQLSVDDVDCATTPSADFDPTANASELEPDSPLLNPQLASEQAPETFWVKFETTEGPFVVKFEREWAPIGVDRVYDLVQMGYYDRVAFFRVLEGFVAQFGIHGRPAVNEAWKDATIEADPVNASNTEGTVSFAQSPAPDSRTAQLFINYADNSRLDAMGFAPVGAVVKCLDNAKALYAGYGEGAPVGSGPGQEQIQQGGNAYLEQFPELDYVIEATVIQGPRAEDVAILADVLVKHATPLAELDPADGTKDCVQRGLTDAVIVTGQATGSPVTPEFLKRVRDTAGEATVLVGSGLSPDNAAELLALCDGALVGTYFKRDGEVHNPVDVDRVRRLVELVRS